MEKELIGKTEIIGPVAVGQIFAERYEIIQHLGTGGMSRVFKANDLLINQHIALKFIQPSIAQNRQLLERFKQELLLARKLAHPNVIRIYEIGEHRGLFYISMEFIEGRTVADLLNEKGRLPLPDFYSVFAQFCTALAYVHSQQIVHRDINPSNLMMEQSGTLKLMDFGIAGDLASDQTPQIPMGTPGYMAPELFKGNPPSRASDIYAAGVMFYQLLTGKKPPMGTIPLGTTQNSPPAVLKEAPDIPSELAKLIEKCLEFNPKNRFQTVEELLKTGSRIDLRLTIHPRTTRTVADLIEAGPRDPASLLPLFLEIVDRLSEIHSAKSLHHELSPGAIELSVDGKVKIRPRDESSFPGTLVITEPKYSSPEIFQERAASDEQFRLASDIYVLGFIFYEVLLGQKAFSAQFAEISQDDQNFQWLRWHSALDKTTPPLKELVSSCPTFLSETLQKMMEKRLSCRIGSLAEVGEALRKGKQQLERDEGMRLHTIVLPSPPSREASPPHRSLAASIAIVTGATIFVAIAAWFLFWISKSSREEKKPQDMVAPSSPTTEHKEPANPRMLDTETGPMILIPEGEFLMGNDHGRVSEDFGYQNEAPVHRLYVPAFYIDKYEVTNRFYKKFSESTGTRYLLNPDWDPDYLDKPNHPAINVSWENARAFCLWAGKRLPTEAEWEKAARGSDGRLYPWGNEFRPGAANLSGAQDSFQYTAPVGTFTQDKGPYGVMDMAGNAFEWVEDRYRLYSSNPARLPESEMDHRVVRGSGFAWSSPMLARITTRGSFPAEGTGSQKHAIGFRCSVDLEKVYKFIGHSPNR